MQRSRRRALKLRPAPLKAREKAEEADSFCISCGTCNVVVFRQLKRSTNSQRLIKCQSCGVISPDFSLSRPRPGALKDLVPLNKTQVQQMVDQVLDAFTHQSIKQKLQRALAFAQGDLGVIFHKYLPVAIEVFAHVVSRFGFSESVEGVMESVRVMQIHARDDEQFVQKLINIRKILTPTANWIQEDNDAEKDDERRREQEQRALQQKKEEERRKELHTLENAKKTRLRAKKIAMGLDPSVERPPVLVDVPPAVVAAIENARVELRVNAKLVQKFQWFFNGKPIEAEAFVSGINRCTLVIAKLTKRVVGEYFCTCENEEGTISTPTCQVSLASLRLSRTGSKLLGTLPSFPMQPCEKDKVIFSVGDKITLCEAKTLASVKAFPTFPTAMEALAWDSQSKKIAAFSAAVQQEKTHGPTEVYFYSPERPRAGPSSSSTPPTATNRQRNTSKFGLASKPKVPSFGSSLKFQLVDVQSIDAVSEVHAAEFVDSGNGLLVADMMHQVALYDLFPFFACKKVFSFNSDTVCHIAVSPQPPMLFALAFRNKPFINLYSGSADKKARSAETLEQYVGFKFPVHRVSFDALGFYLAVVETGFMKSWISIINVSTRKPSNRRFKAHTGRISGLQWTMKTSLLISSSLDGYVKVWDPVASSNLLSIHMDTYGVHSMLLMEELVVLIILGYSDCRLQSRSVLQLPELEASRLVEMNTQAANIQKLWKGRKTRELISKYIKASEK